VKTASGLERVLAAAGGFLVGGVGSAIVGATMGYREMAKSLLPQIGLFIGMLLLGVTNPWLIIAALLTGGVLQGMLNANSTTQTLKLKIAEKVAQNLRESADENAEKIAAQVLERTGKLAEAIDAGIGKEIQAVREQVEAVIAAKNEGEARVRSKQQELANCEAEIKRLDNELRDLILLIAEQR
jgi:hypothetical protein